MRDKRTNNAKTFPSKWVICLVLVFSIFALFYQVVDYDFVNYDDSGYVGDNVHVQNGLTRDGIIWAFTTGHMSNWHPLTWLSHMLDMEIFGPKPGAQHFTNILFHALNSLLVFLVFEKMTGALWRSGFAAALFALHPLHVESVAWISERKDLLSTFFWMLTIWAYVVYAENKLRKKNRAANTKFPRSFYFLSLLFFTLGLMSKPMVVTLPFVLLLLDIWPLQRLQLPQEKGRINLDWRGLSRLFAEKLPFFTLTIGASIVTFIVQKKGGAVSSLAGLSMISRIENSVISYVRYIGKTFWPNDLSILYPHPGSWPLGPVIAASLFLLGVSALAIWLARSRAYFLVGWFWFLGTLVPVIGLVQVGMQSIADRYTYIPLIGLFGALTWGAADVFSRWNFPKVALGMGAGIILFCCAALTKTQVGYWRDSETLFGHAIKVTKKNFIAYNNLGFFYSHKERYNEAIESYRKSLEIEPRFEDAHNNLGYALAKLGNHQEAIAHYNVALKLKPELVEAHNNLGNSLAEIGKVDEAIAHYEIVLAKNPRHADALNNFGVALAMKGKLNEAIEHFKKSLAAKPNYASAHSNLGNAYAVQGKFDEAMVNYLACLKIKPDDSQAHNNLANVLTQKNRTGEAMEHYLTSLKLNQKNPEAHFNLGLLLLRQSRREEALAQFQEALREKPDYIEAKRQISELTATAK
ncbi:MAG: tetratricopeptide repeat protein [Verrucomicrobiota bacterium]